MPAGHPFQGSQPKHLEEGNRASRGGRVALPRKPYLSKHTLALIKTAGETEYDTEKMMRYDDFTNEDVGNIIMDAEPKQSEDKNSRQEEDDEIQPLSNLVQEANSFPNIQEFDEDLKRTPYQTSGNRPIFSRNPGRYNSGNNNRNFRQFRQGKI